MARAVFLDRDGVIIRTLVRDDKPYPPATLDQVILDPHAELALQRLSQAGYLLIVVTNQPDVARGRQSRAAVEAINDYLCRSLRLDGCFVCYHDDADHCDCRKPLPGLLLRAAEQHNIDLRSSFLIGDRWRDVEAGYAAGCRTVWIDREYRERLPARLPDVRLSTLEDAAAWILSQPRVVY
jgi:D-glycero-D-manno-heptose 1,7-bisphosphate phosphatase